MAAAVTGHGGVGIVEQVGSMVRRVRPGDLVIMSIQANCGTCSNCTIGRGDLCRGLVGRMAAPTGKLSDGTSIQRTFAATRSVEYDAVLLAGSPLPGADALVVRDSKAGEETARGIEIYLAVTGLYVVSALAINRVMAFIEKRVRVPGMVASTGGGGH